MNESYSVIQIAEISYGEEGDSKIWNGLADIEEGTKMILLTVRQFLLMIIISNHIEYLEELRLFDVSEYILKM